MQEVEPFWEARWKNVVAVPRTRQMHCFIASGSDKLMVADTSDSTCFTTVCIRNAIESDEEGESNNIEKEEDSE